MIGDYFGGYPAGGLGSFVLDRLSVIANDLDAPAVLPPGGATLTITEAGPVGIFANSLANLQQLQQLLRTGGPLPTSTLAGTVADSATMTTTLTISQMQALLAATPQAYDIVPLAAPPGSYDTAVAAAFATRNGAGGVTSYDGDGSGALLQAGVDTLTGSEDFDAFYFYTYALAVNVPSPGAGIGPTGRMKVADGNNALPRNRVYFRYDLLDGLPIAPSGIDMDRFTPGFERTFLDDLLSLEMRFPFAATLTSDTVAGKAGHDVEWGNIGLFLKGLIYARDAWLLSAGLGLTLPTADDIHVRLANGTPLVHVENQSVHLKPYVSAMYTPSSKWFAHGFLEVDVDANSNRTSANLGNGLTPIGRLTDATFLFADAGVGCWLIDNGQSFLTGFAPTVELHYNQSLQPADNLAAGAMRVGSFGGNAEALNLTLGATCRFGAGSNLALGYITSLGGGGDQQLDGGLRVLFEYAP